MYYVDEVLRGSLAKKAKIKVGDCITHINNREVTDGLLFGYLISSSPVVTLDIVTKKGKKRTVEIENDYEDIGIVSERPMVENPKSCHNKCIFCFIDQLPCGMREPLYFKDDDIRLSFLTGNYVTFTNMKEEEFENILKMRLSPINVSVHTTNDELRKKMLNNRFAGGIKDKIKRLIENHITVNAQIVLCKGWNDGEELEKSIKDLYELGVNSLSVVPMGQTKYREKLQQVELFTKEDCRNVVEIINKYGEISQKEQGKRFVYPSDEFFVKGEIPVPDESYYDGFPQIENGVGMLTSFEGEFFEGKNDLKRRKKRLKKKTIVTSYSAYDMFVRLCNEFKKEFDCEIEVVKIKNNFFGEHITVAGLLTATDIIEQLKNRDLGMVVLPKNIFRSEGDLTLDGKTFKDIKNALKTKVVLCENNGCDFFNCLHK